MQRKINQYWKKKKTSHENDETSSSLPTKVEKIVSNASVQNIAVSDRLPMDQDRVEEECSTSTVVPSVWTEQQYKQFSAKILGYTLVMKT